MPSHLARKKARRNADEDDQKKADDEEKDGGVGTPAVLSPAQTSSGSPATEPASESAGSTPAETQETASKPDPFLYAKRSASGIKKKKSVKKTDKAVDPMKKYKAVGKPDIFLSYPWNGKFFDVTFRALGWQLGLNSQSSETKIWIDIFAITQNQGARTVDDLSELESAIMAAGRTVLFMPDPTLKVNPLTRIWCCYEIFKTLSHGCTLQMMFPGNTEVARQANALLFHAGRLDGKVRVQNAEATVPDDRQMILKQIRESNLTLDEMNKQIEDALRDSAGKFLTAQEKGSVHKGWSEDDVEKARTVVAKAFQGVGKDWYKLIKKGKSWDAMKICVERKNWKKLGKTLVKLTSASPKADAESPPEVAADAPPEADADSPPDAPPTQPESTT